MGTAPRAAAGRTRRSWLAAAWFALACGAAPGALADGAIDVARLMQMLEGNRGGQALFTETRHVAMLEQVLQSSGRLTFEAPDTFVRETLRPRSERVAVTGNQLTLTQGNRTRVFALDAAPEAAVMIEAIRGTLTGNRQTLERYFKLGVGGEARDWWLELVPLESRLRDQVRTIRVAGGHSQVREVQVMLADGDRSVMSIEPLAATAPARRASGP